MEFKIFIFSLLLNGVYGLKEHYTIDARTAYDQELYESVLDSELCQQQLNYLPDSVNRLPFIDASAKPPSGILTGNLNDLGNYFQCLAINIDVDEEEHQFTLEGKYCTIIVPLDQTGIEIPDIDIDIPGIGNITDLIPEFGNITDLLPDNVIDFLPQYQAMRRYALGVSGFGEPVESRIFPPELLFTQGATYGLCIPKACTTEEAVDFFLDNINVTNVNYREYFCRLPNDKLLSGADYAAIAIFGFLGLLIILSTTYDLYCTFVLKNVKQLNKLYVCFSIYTNTRRYLTFTTVPGSLDCVDGIRAISMLWIVVGHTYAFTLAGYIQNLDSLLDWVTHYSSIWINSAPITVDTFFTLSGILVVYTTIGKISRTRFIRTLHLFYLNRLLRLFPLLATMVLLQASLFNHMSDGPFWLNVSQQAENCRKWWWSILLHVQNYVNPLEICIPQTWYLSVDMQLYFFCPLVMVWMFGRELYAWIALCFIVLASLVISTVYSFMYNFSAALANPTRLNEFLDYATTYYANTLPRAAPFFIGMVYGYILHLCRNKQIRIAKMNVAILWILAMAMMAFCIFSIYPVIQPEHEGQIFDNFLNAYMRAIWACGLGWMIFACVHGYGGPINWFLSLSMWKLPARMSFAMYLVHLPIILVANGSWTQTFYFTDGKNMYRFMSDLTLTFLASFVLCIAIDAPFSTLQKLLMGSGKKPPQKQKSESQNNIVEDEPPVIKTTL